jgi:hypothetical protein
MPGPGLNNQLRREHVMKRVRTWSAALAAGLLTVALWGGSAAAEVFFDLYGLIREC